jgi:hypothetical protein
MIPAKWNENSIPFETELHPLLWSCFSALGMNGWTLLLFPSPRTSTARPKIEAASESSGLCAARLKKVFCPRPPISTSAVSSNFLTTTNHHGAQIWLYYCLAATDDSSRRDRLQIPWSQTLLYGAAQRPPKNPRVPGFRHLSRLRPRYLDPAP